MSSKPGFPTSPEQYEKLYKIGFNAWKARLKSDPEIEVVTKLHNVDASYEKEFIKNEINELEEMCRDHDHVMVKSQHFFVDSVLWIVYGFSSWSEGTVRDLMTLHNHLGDALDESLVRAIAAQLLAPLEFLHANGRIFRDLRCKNLMVTADGKVQLQLLTLPSILQERAPIYKDSLFWASPELLMLERVPGSSLSSSGSSNSNPNSSVGPEVDVWALGMTLLELALGDPPFSPDLTPSQILQAIVEGEPPTLPSDVAPLWSKGFKDVIQRCLVKDPTQRATITELKLHPFFAGAPGPDFIKQHLLAPLPPIEQRWKILTQIREQQEAAKQERDKLAQQQQQQQAQTQSQQVPNQSQHIPHTQLQPTTPSLQSPTDPPESVGVGPVLGIPNIVHGTSLTSSSSAPAFTNSAALGPTIPLDSPGIGGMPLSTSTNSAPGGGFTPRGVVSSNSSSSVPVTATVPLSTVPTHATPSGNPAAANATTNTTAAAANASNVAATSAIGNPENPFLVDAAPFKSPPAAVRPTPAPSSSAQIPLQNTAIPTTSAVVPSTSTSSVGNPSSMAAPHAGNGIPAHGIGSQSQEPTRGRFRIVNPGSNAATPSGSLDFGTMGISVHPTPVIGGQPFHYQITDATGSNSANASVSAPAPTAMPNSQVSGSQKSHFGSLVPAQTPASNVPIEAYLAENERDYIVIFRALPGTVVSVTLEGRTVLISGQVPPLPHALLKQLHTSERPVGRFERRVQLPGEIDPTDFSKELLREQNTMLIRVKKCPKSVHIGDDMF